MNPVPEEYRRSLGFFSNERQHIRDMFKKLSWDVSEDEQAYAVDYLAKNMLPSEYIYLVFANDYKMDYLNEELAYLKFGNDKGKWEFEIGNNQIKAGYNYDQVQAKVNELLSGTAPAAPAKSVEEVAREVIQGKWGNGADRKAALEKAGYSYDEVQAKVNALLK